MHKNAKRNKNFTLLSLACYQLRRLSSHRIQNKCYVPDNTCTIEFLRKKTSREEVQRCPTLRITESWRVASEKNDPMILKYRHNAKSRRNMEQEKKKTKNNALLEPVHSNMCEIAASYLGACKQTIYLKLRPVRCAVFSY